jgi:hypothetical protein
MDKFVVILSQSTAAQQNALTKWVSSAPSVSYWHYSPEVWLLSFAYSKSTPELRDEVRRIVESVPPPLPHMPDVGSFYGSLLATPTPRTTPIVPTGGTESEKNPYTGIISMLAGSSPKPIMPVPQEVYVMVLRFRDEPGQTDWAAFGPMSWTQWFKTSF